MNASDPAAAPFAVGERQRIHMRESSHASQEAAMPAPGERRSPACVQTRGTGLPLLSTEPLTAAERAALRDLVRAMRATADRVEEALDKNRVAYAIEACAVAGELGTAAQRAAAVIGSSR